MLTLYSILIVALSSLLWRIRGGLWQDKIPENKIWYGLAFAIYGCFYFSFGFENALVGFLAAYVSYQLYGWGLYVGRLISGGELNPNLKQYRECELIDDILYSMKISFSENAASCFNKWLGWLIKVEPKTYYLYKRPRVFGFLGTTLSGLIVTFLWGLFLGNVVVMVSGLAMGVCYWLGYLLNKLWPERKGGWGYGEYIFGAYLGAVLAWALLW